MASESTLTALADEVAAAIRGQTFAEYLDVRTTYQPVKRREDLGNRWLVEVLPRAQKRQRLTRRRWQVMPTIVVGITVAIAEANDDRQTDHCNAVADAIAEYLQTNTWTLGYLQEIDEAPTYHPQRLDLDGVFTRAMVLTFGGREAHA